MKQIAIQSQLTVNSVTLEMIHEARQNILTRDIIAVLNYIKGNVLFMVLCLFRIDFLVML